MPENPTQPSKTRTVLETLIEFLPIILVVAALLFGYTVHRKGLDGGEPHRVVVPDLSDPPSSDK